MDAFLLNPWIVGTGTTVLATLALYMVGIGRDKNGRVNLSNTLGVKAGRDITAGRDIIISNGKNSRTSNKPSSSGSSEITPEKIMKSLKHLTPFQRHNIEEDYKGIKVNWSVIFKNLVPRSSEGKHYLLSNYLGLDGFLVLVTGDINADSYPQLKLIGEESKITIEGTINEVDYDGQSIRLDDDPTLYF